MGLFFRKQKKIVETPLINQASQDAGVKVDIYNSQILEKEKSNVIDLQVFKSIFIDLDESVTYEENGIYNPTEKLQIFINEESHILLKAMYDQAMQHGVQIPMMHHNEPVYHFQGSYISPWFGETKKIDEQRTKWKFTPFTPTRKIKKHVYEVNVSFDNSAEPEPFFRYPQAWLSFDKDIQRTKAKVSFFMGEKHFLIYLKVKNNEYILNKVTVSNYKERQYGEKPKVLFAS